MNKFSTDALPARAERNFTDYALIAAVSYIPIVSAINELMGWSSLTLAALFILGALIFTAALFASARTGVMHRSASPAGLFLGLFLAASALSTALADQYRIRYDDEAMWNQLAVAMFPAVLFWGGRAWAARRFDADILDRAVILLFVFYGASIVLEVGGITNYDYGGGGGRNRWFGYLGDGVAWIIAFQATYFFARGRLVLFGVALGLLFLTLSRAPFALLALSIVIYVFLARVADLKSVVIRAAALLVAAGFAVFAQDLVGQLLGRLTGTDLLENDRVRTIQFTLEVFQAHPVTGAGYNAHTYFFAPLASSINPLLPQLGTPVSTWTQILADSGVVGFIPFLIWALYCCRAAFRALRIGSSSADDRALMGLSAWLLVFLPVNQSAAWLLPISTLSPVVFIVAGIVVGRASQLVRQSPSQQPQASAPNGVLARR